MTEPTFYVCTLQRAAEIKGGPAPLARWLGVSNKCLAAWIAGQKIPAPNVFFRALELVLDFNSETAPSSQKETRVTARMAK